MNDPQQPDDEAPQRHAFAGRLIVAALVGLFLVNLFFLRQNWTQVRPTPRGGAAPEFSVPLLGGGSFRLAEHRGHAVFVDFWATWCGPCRESLPILDRVYREPEHQSAGLRVVAIETESAEPEARAMAARLQLTMPIGLGDGELSGRYGVSSIPHLVLIGKKGQIRRVFRGVHSQAELSRAAAEAEAEAP